MEPQTPTYAQAIAELEGILAKMQSPDCDIDNLARYAARAIELLKQCRAKLTTCAAQLRKSLEALPQTL